MRLGLSGAASAMDGPAQADYWDPGSVAPDSGMPLRTAQQLVLRNTMDSVENLTKIPYEDSREACLDNLGKILHLKPAFMSLVPELIQEITGIQGLRITPAGTRQADITDQDGTSLTRMGTGIRSILNLAARGAAAPRGATLLLEHPERGLDPGRRLELGGMFATLHRRRGVNSIIETHSDDILLQLRFLIATRLLQPHTVTIAFLPEAGAPETGGPDQAPTIRNISINPDGTLEPGLPMSFFGANIIRALRMNAAQTDPLARRTADGQPARRNS